MRVWDYAVGTLKFVENGSGKDRMANRFEGLWMKGRRIWMEIRCEFVKEKTQTKISSAFIEKTQQKRINSKYMKFIL